MNNTIFEKIATGEIPSHEIYQDSDFFAFLDIKPESPGHTLLIPKICYETIEEIPDELLMRLIVLVKKISTVLKKSLGANGIKIVVNNGKSAGQEIPHLHFHVIPYYDNKVMKKKSRNYEEETEEIMKKIRENI